MHLISSAAISSSETLPNAQCNNKSTDKHVQLQSDQCICCSLAEYVLNLHNFTAVIFSLIIHTINKMHKMTIQRNQALRQFIETIRHPSVLCQHFQLASEAVLPILHRNVS